MELTRKLECEYAEAAEKRKVERPTLPMPDVWPGDPAAVCFAHLENIRHHLTIDDCCVDAMIVLRLRSNDYSRERVEKIIRACAPTIRDSQAGRTAAYAFGLAGDRDFSAERVLSGTVKKIKGAKEKAHKAGHVRMIWYGQRMFFLERAFSV